MTLENCIKDTIAEKMSDGTVEKLVAEQVEKGIEKALSSLFSGYGDMNKLIEGKLKSVMVPYLERHDFSSYLVKLDFVLTEVVKNSATENKKLLENFKDLMQVEDRKTITASELFEIWTKFVAEEVETSGLEVNYEDSVRYETVDCTMTVDYSEDRSWGNFAYATLVFECQHDKEMNFAIRLNRWNKEKVQNLWSMTYCPDRDLNSLRRLSSFEVLLMKLNQAGTNLILDTDSEREDVTPDKEPEAEFR